MRWKYMYVLCSRFQQKKIDSMLAQVIPAADLLILVHECLSKRWLRMAATRRLTKELADIRKSGITVFQEIEVNETNILVWTGLLVPDNAPYNKAAYRIELTFPAEYPFKPPKLLFKTPIYHPNVDEKGQICLPIITAENWKPATKTDQVIASLVTLINTPEPGHPLRADLAEEYTKDLKKFQKNAEEHAKKYALTRPA